MENILEYLIPLIFIISIFSMRKKKKKSTEQKQGQPQAVQQNPGSGGVFGKLNKMLEDYYQSDLKGAPKQGGAGTRVEEPLEMQPLPREPEPWEDEDDVRQPVKVQMRRPVQTQMIRSAVEPEPVAETAAVPKELVTPVKAAAVATRVTAKSVVPGMEEYQSESTSYHSSKMRREDLRRAVAWSEILSPPKALSED